MSTDTPAAQATGTLKGYHLSHLEYLEAESMHIIREAVAEGQNPVMLFSVGKDSGVMLELARRAFYPEPVPFPLLQIDCCWDFQAMYELREELTKKYDLDMRVYSSAAAKDPATDPFALGSQAFTDMTLTSALREGLDEGGYDVIFGGGRRDEERSRAKERIFSVRDQHHQWEPRKQRPELWNLYNVKLPHTHSVRVFPLSNWTELDIWMYTKWRNVPLVPIYFAAKRPVVERDGQLIMVDDDRMKFLPGEEPVEKMVRFRTLGAYPFTAANESNATTINDIILELLTTQRSERSGRLIDTEQEAAMEMRKREGYF
jgi:sulfate adenylyltransferase subunit 2